LFKIDIWREEVEDLCITKARVSLTPIMKRNLFLLFKLIHITLIVLITAAGCTSGIRDKSGNVPNDAKPFKLALRHIEVREDALPTLKLLEEVAAATEAKIPGLDIELEGVEDAVNRDQKLPAEMATGNPPEIFNLFGGTDTQKYAKANRLLDLTPILEELNIKDKFVNLTEFTVNGKVYGLPLAGYVEGIFYNKKMFKQYNLTVPTTWDEFLNVCETFKSMNITPLALAGKDGWVLNMTANYLWIRTAGPESVQGFVDGTMKWTDSHVVDGFKKYELLIQKGYVQEDSLALDYAEQQNLFRTGEAAMVVDASWAANAMFDKEKSQIADDLGFFNFPNVGGPGDGVVIASFSNGYGFSAKIADHEQKLKAVKEFIKQLYNSKVQKRQLLERGWLPSMLLDNNDGVNPIIVNILATAQSATARYPAFDSTIRQKTKLVLEQAVQAIVGGQLTSEQAMAKVQEAQDEENKSVK
jgi:raffinose/stachyose/melibiose transport system substrate-binding protein